MKNIKSKLIIAVYVLVAIVLAYLAYPVVKERYFSGVSEKERSEDEMRDVEEEEDDDFDQLRDEDEDEDNDADEDENENTDPVEEDDPFIEVTKTDCQNRCEKFKDDPEDLEYCRQVCGFSTLRQDADGCADLEGLEIDYCYKDLAISQKDFKICDKISDKGVKSTCVNRVTEELFEL